MKTRLAAVVLVFAMVAVACGQKPGVHRKGVLSGEAPVGFGGGAATSTTTDPSLGTPTDPALGATTTDPATGTTTTDPATGITTTDPATGTTPTTGGGTNPPGGGTTAPSATVGGPPDITGVSANQIIIGIHAPVTGAAPVTSKSFETGGPLYWDHGANGGPVKIFNRSVKVLFRNDEYNPSTARQKCKELAEGEKAFLLIGGAGTDQIKSCADYAATKGIPYLSAGVTETPLARNPVYFGLSMTYKAQGTLLAQYVKKVLNVTDASKVAAIVTATSNFDDALNAFKAAMGPIKVIRPSKTASGGSYANSVCSGPTKLYPTVFVLTSPTFFLELEGSASCNPQYVGVGISMGLDEVADIGCKSPLGSMNGAQFFSPFPAFGDTASKDQAFTKAGGADDIEYALWGLSKTLAVMLERSGKDLSRQGFIKAVSSAKGISTGIFPPLSFSPTDHFGADQTYVLKAVCEGTSSGHYETLKGLSGSF